MNEVVHFEYELTIVMRKVLSYRDMRLPTISVDKFVRNFSAEAQIMVFNDVFIIGTKNKQRPNLLPFYDKPFFPVRLRKKKQIEKIVKQTHGIGQAWRRIRMFLSLASARMSIVTIAVI